MSLTTKANIRPFVFERLFDNRIFRIVIGAAIGLPLSAAAVIAGLEAIFLSIGGVLSQNYQAVLLGPSAILGLLGIAGAWRRLVRRNIEMKPSERRIVRLSLYGGILSGIALMWISYSYINSWEFAVLFAAVSTAGTAFVLATPQRIPV